MSVHKRTIGRRAATVGLAALLATVAAPAAPADASLLGGLLGTVTGLVGVVTAGWDDGTTTAPTRLSEVTTAVGAERVWSRGFDGSGVDVAVIDSGVAPVNGLTAEGKVLRGPDLSFESQADEFRHLDTFGHGTHMAGIIAGRDDEGTAFRGVAPGSRVVSLKVATRDGAVDVSQVIAAIDWVVQHRKDAGMNIRVLNLSYGTDGLQSRTSDPLAYAVEAAWRNGIVVVVAGGNDGTDRAALVNPATNPYVLAVGAVDLAGTTAVDDDAVAVFSSRGSSARYVDVVAPGVSIASLRDPGSYIDDAHPDAVVDERFFRGSGTSQAAAVTSGAAALLLDARPTLTPDQVKSLLRSTATSVPNANARSQGSGRINVDLASRTTASTTRQTWTQGTGIGSLEKARGTSHVASDGVELTGEQDVIGMPLSGSAWAPLALGGKAWSGGFWNGTEWTGNCFCTTYTSDPDLTGKSWTGKSWTGKSWTGKSWTGPSR